MWETGQALADAAAAWLLIPLAIWILINGLDDLVVDVAAVCAWRHRRREAPPTRRELLRAPQQRIAIFVPCWHESEVIADMVSGNRERVQYGHYDFFIGCYPNDEATLRVVRELERRFSNVHLALCPHQGPTSKADCLNWIYQRMQLFEEDYGRRFDIVMTHDAEDVIHQDSLLWVNWYTGHYDMVQVPVLPLATPVRRWTHAVYCDEFSEYQCRDMPARQWMGAFVPSNGVGTGFARSALEAMAAAEGNRIFEPACLTEDYENGLRLRLRGARQLFLSVPDPSLATREYFPQSAWLAVRQRTRWVTGIALQTWQRHGWRGSAADRYWLWHDRKGLIGNPASLAANALFLYGLVATGGAFQERLDTWAPLLWTTAGLGIYRTGFRCWAVGRRFGWRIAVVVPVRIVLANVINCAATMLACWQFGRAWVRREPLRWIKTTHEYPSQEFLRESSRQLLGAILINGGYITAGQLARALESRPHQRRLGEHLIALGFLREPELYQALSLQWRLPLANLDSTEIRKEVARSLPRRVIRDRRILPFRVEDGKLLVASAENPEPAAADVLRQFTRLDIRFCLASPSDLREAIAKLTA